MKNLKVRVRIIAPVVVAIILCAASILTAVTVKFDGYVMGDTTDTVNVNMRVLKKNLFDRYKNAESAALLTAEDPEIIAAFTKSDHDLAVTIAQKVIKETGVDFITVLFPNADILARGHNPDKFGDNLGDLPSVVAARSGNVTVGIETGNTMPLTIRGGSPVYNEAGTLVGIINAGYDLSKTDFVDDEKELLGSEITIFFGDTRIATTLADEGGNRLVGTQASGPIAEQVLSGSDYVGRAVVNGEDAIAHYSPLKSSDGKIVGMLFVGEYIASANKATMSFLTLGIIVTLIIGVIVTLLVSQTSKTITDPIAMMMSYLRQISSTGSLEFTQSEWTATRKEAVYKDEISQSLAAFIDMLEHFIYYGEYLKKAAALDFSDEVKELSVRDTFGHGISEVVQGISSAMSDVQRATTQMQQGVAELAGASANLADDAQSQAASIDGLNNSVNDIRSLADENSELAALALREVGQTERLMQDCMKEMNKTVVAMNEINSGSEDIRAVIKTIDDIAFQTNILALNAAVEAARAGQHGKGFAVVAEEVRNLAIKSADAASQTAELIEDNAKKAADGIDIVQTVNEKLQKVVKISAKNAKDINKINEASQRQKESVSKVSGEIEEMQRLIQSNSATAEEVAAQGQAMRDNANDLHDVVVRFKISDKIVNKGKVSIK